jgi:hypothetical protein
MQAPDALSRCMKSDATDCISSPDESDPYFPYVAEQTGNIDIIAVNSSGEQIKHEMQLNHMIVIPNESDNDTGYTADTEDDSVLKVGNDSISTYHLANTEMCHLNSAFIQEEKIISLQISDLNVALSHDGKNCFSSFVISILAYFENSQDEKCITSATPVRDSVVHDTQLSFGNDSISEPLNSLQNKVFTEHADHIIGIDNSSHTQEKVPFSRQSISGFRIRSLYCKYHCFNKPIPCFKCSSSVL